MIEDRVLIAGAGPVGLVAAAQLVRKGIPVTVLEAGNDLSTESRASTFHPPTLDMLDELGVARHLIGEGLKAPKLQFRSKKDGLIAQWHPRRLKLTDTGSDASGFVIECVKYPDFGLEIC